MTITKKMIEKAAREYTATVNDDNERSALNNAIFHAVNDYNLAETQKLFAQAMDAAQLCNDDNEKVAKVANIAYDSVETLLIQRFRTFNHDGNYGRIAFGRLIREMLINMDELCAIVNEAISAAE